MRYRRGPSLYGQVKQLEYDTGRWAQNMIQSGPGDLFGASSLALVPGPILHEEDVLVPLVPGFVSSFGLLWLLEVLMGRSGVYSRECPKD